MSAFSSEEVSYFITFARERGLTYLEIEQENKALGIELPSVRKQTAVISKTPVGEKDGQIIRSLLVGYFRPLPELKEGAHVNKDTVIGIVEALGLPNEVTSGVSGKIERIFAKDGAAVEYGQPLAKLGVIK